MNPRSLLACYLLIGCSGTSTANVADAALAVDTPFGDDRSSHPEVFLDAGPDVALDRTGDSPSVTDGGDDTSADVATSDVSGDALATHDRADAFDSLQAPRCAAPFQASVGTNYSTLLYPPTTIAVFGATTSTQTSFDTEARWLGTRALTQPFLAQCGQGETAHPCSLDRLLRLQLPDMQVLELLLSIDYDTLDAPALNAPIRLSLGVNRGDYRLSDITILDAEERVVLAAYSNRTQGGDSWRIGGIQLSVSPTTAPPTCISIPQPLCERVFGSYPLNLEPYGVETFAPQSVPATESAVVSTMHGRYRVDHRKTLRQIQGHCSSTPISESQFELIRVRN